MSRSGNDDYDDTLLAKTSGCLKMSVRTLDACPVGAHENRSSIQRVVQGRVETKKLRKSTCTSVTSHRVCVHTDTTDTGEIECRN